MRRRVAHCTRSVATALFILIGAFGYGGCSGGGTAPAPNGTPGTPTPEPAPDGMPIELRLDQPKEIDGLMLTWVSFEDSRCPQGVTCVWAGEAAVRIRVRDAGADSEISAKLGSTPDEAVATTTRHEIRLTAVEPYPRHGSEVAREERRASIVVKRR